MSSNVPVVRVCVPFPNNGGLHPKTKASLANLLKCDKLDCKNNILEVQGASISLLRSNAVTGGRSDRCYQSNFTFDYFLSIDSDIEFTPEDVINLIRHDVDIVSGAYKYRNNQGLATAGKFSGIPGVIDTADFLLWEDSGIHKVDWVGGGFLLIKKAVFEKIKYPYFREGIVEFDKAGQIHASWVGEDVGFCIAAKEAGFEILCDMDVKVNHLIADPFVSNQPEPQKAYTPDEAYKFFMETLNTLKGCGDMFYNGLLEYAKVFSGAYQNTPNLEVAQKEE